MEVANNVETISALRNAGFADWMAEALTAKVRDPFRDLSHVLREAGSAVAIENVLATCRCHFVAHDANGRARVDALVETLVAEIVSYCIPRSRINEAQAHLLGTGSPARFSQLHREAQALFSEIATSGEGGELLLFLLLEAVLGLPQILCKMSLKTNAQMHYHGVDGIHAKVIEDDVLALYWGESKLYASVTSGIDACFESIAPFLLDEGGGPANRDTLLLRQNLDLGDAALTDALKRYFTSTAPEARKVRVRGACLVGFDHANYADPCAAGSDTVREEVAAEMSKWHDRIGSSILKNKLESFEIEVFCVPLPSVATFRTKLGASLGPSTV